MTTTPLIPRRLRPIVEGHLRIFPAVALLGPRQSGKTTLARMIADTDGTAASHRERPGLYLDLENPAHRERLSDAGSYLGSVRNRLVVLDEVHRVPELFRELRGIIDERIRDGEPAGHFLVLGSASMKLMRQSGETLAGRIGYLTLDPLDIREIDGAGAERLWVRGGFPRSFLAGSTATSVLWRQNFIRTYLERDILGMGPRIASETMRRFWTMLAHSQGGLWNGATFARSLAVDGKTVARYLDLTVDLLLARRLPPFHANVRKRLVKSPKVYLRDSGIVHALLGIDSRDELLGHPVAGASWEGFVIEALLRSAPSRTRASFYRTATGNELDLILDLPGGPVWAIDVKRGLVGAPNRRTVVALEDVNPDRAFLVYGGRARYPAAGGVDVLGLMEMTEELARLT